MTTFIQKLLGLESRKSASTLNKTNRVQLRVENLEQRVLQATGLVWQLHSAIVGDPQNYTSGAQTKMNIRQNHLDLTETASGKKFMAAIDFSSMPTEIKGGQTFQITAKVVADGAFEIGPGSKYRSQITGKAQDGYKFSDVVVSGKVISPKGEKSYPKGVDRALRTETVTFTIKAPTAGTSFTISQSAPGFSRWMTPSVTFYAFRPKADNPPPPPVKDGIQATFSGNTLTVQGTEKADTNIIDQNSDRISVRGVQIMVNGKLENNVYVGVMGKINIYAKGGDDKVYLNGGKQDVYISTMIDGGAGKDLLVGAQRGNNTIYGGDHNDTIWGGLKNDGLKNDYLYGEYGEDTIYGQDGNDFLSGGWGSDSLEGGLGDDTLYGDQNNDKLFGRDGTDMLFGGEGSDWLEAGSGAEFADFGKDASGQSDPRFQDKDFNAHVWALRGATFDDVHQAAIGNCAFLASVSSLALRGVNLSSRIKYLGNFMYRVDIFDGNGKFSPQTIKFDGVTYPGDPHPSERGEYWVVLLRQAFRQMRGAMDDNMVVSECLTALTGRATTHTWNHLTPSRDQFNRIDLAIKRGQNVVTGTRDDKVNDTRLVRKHAYTVVAVARDNQGNPNWVLLRNPHGQYATQGALIRVSWSTFMNDMSGVFIN